MAHATPSRLLAAFRAGFAAAWAARRDGPGASAGGARRSLGVLEVDDLPGLIEAAGSRPADRLLRQIEAVLRRAQPPGAALDRPEEGLFTVDLPAMSGAAAEAELERMRGAASQVHVSGDGEVVCRRLSAMRVEPRSGEGRGEAVHRARGALEAARLTGGGRRPDRAAPDAGDLTAAASAQTLGYHVQPVVELSAGRIAGVEALLRWTARDGTAVGPGEDIVDALERIPEGLEHVLPALVERVAAPILSRPGTFVSLNVTGAVLDGQGSSSCLWLQEVLRRLPPERLVVEILETAVMARPARAEALVGRMRAQGVRVALDDFGTGLSNLDRLRRMPVDILKIDRAFVSGLGGGGREEIILRNLARMTAELGMEVVAEGIETAAEARAVSALGIRFGQGYHLGRPAPVEIWASRLDAGP